MVPSYGNNMEQPCASLCCEAVRKIGAVFSDDGGVDPYVVTRPKSAVVEVTYFATLDTHWLTFTMDPINSFLETMSFAIDDFFSTQDVLGQGQNATF